MKKLLFKFFTLFICVIFLALASGINVCEHQCVNCDKVEFHINSLEDSSVSHSSEVSSSFENHLDSECLHTFTSNNLFFQISPKKIIGESYIDYTPILSIIFNDNQTDFYTFFDKYSNQFFELPFYLSSRDILSSYSILLV